MALLTAIGSPRPVVNMTQQSTRKTRTQTMYAPVNVEAIRKNVMQQRFSLMVPLKREGDAPRSRDGSINPCSEVRSVYAATPGTAGKPASVMSQFE